MSKKAQVVTFTNQKGGPGKTTTCHNIGKEVAALGKKVLFVDNDGQGNLSTLCDLKKNDLKYTIANLLIDSSVDYGRLVHRTNIDNIDIIPSNRETYFAEKHLANMAAREFILSDKLDKLKEDYDYIFIDTPPNLGLLTFSSLVAANHLIIIYTSSELSLDGMADVLRTIIEIQSQPRVNINDTKILGGVHNLYAVGSKTINLHAQKELKNVQGIIPNFFGTIRRSTEIEKAQVDHLAVSKFNPRHDVSNDYKKVAKEIVKCLN